MATLVDYFDEPGAHETVNMARTLTWVPPLKKNINKQTHTSEQPAAHVNDSNG